MRGDAALVTNIFDEHALEVALQLRENTGEGKITLVSVGPQSAEDVLRKGLSMQADDAVLVKSDNLINMSPLDVASVLAAAIKKLDGFDLVLCGRESGDWNTGQIGGMLAEQIGLTYVPFVASIEQAGASLRFRAQGDDGWEIIEAPFPLLATIINDVSNAPRIPKIRDVITASRRNLRTWTIWELGIDLDPMQSSMQTRLLYTPAPKGTCELIDGDSPEEKVARLCEKLFALKVI